MENLKTLGESLEVADYQRCVLIYYLRSVPWTFTCQMSATGILWISENAADATVDTPT